MRRINGTPRWLYRLRYVFAAARILISHGWPIAAAFGAAASDFDNGDDSQHDGYSPEDSARESLSYWQ